jgi:small membrane protein
MSFKLVLVAILGAFFVYVLLLPRQVLLRKTFIIGFVAIMVGFVLQPDLSTTIANYFGIARGADFLFYLSHLVLFLIAFIYYLKFKDMEIRFARIVRSLAISNAQDPETSVGPGRIPGVAE